MKQFIMGAALLMIGLFFNFVETWYFGWNIAAQSPEEMVCDYISKFFVYAGMLLVMWACWVKKEQKQYFNVTINGLDHQTVAKYLEEHAAEIAEELIKHRTV